jgi:hypothetical protein
MFDLGAAQRRWTPAVTMGLPHLGDIGLLTDTTYRRAHGKRRGRTCTAAACCARARDAAVTLTCARRSRARICRRPCAAPSAAVTLRTPNTQPARRALDAEELFDASAPLIGQGFAVDKDQGRRGPLGDHGADATARSRSPSPRQRKPPVNLHTHIPTNRLPFSGISPAELDQSSRAPHPPLGQPPDGRRRLVTAPERARRTGDARIRPV